MKQPNSLATFLNMAPRLSKAVSASVVGATDQTLDMFQFGTPNIDAASIVILRADGVALVAGSGGTDDYEYTASTNSILFRAAGVDQPTAVTSNPVRIFYAYVPQVTFVGAPTLVTTVAGGMGDYFPVSTHLGGGLYSASTPGFVASVVVTNGGGPYVTAPGVTIAAPTTPGGRTATAAAILSGGAVVRVVITDPGSGYIVANPAVSFDAGAAAATAVVGPVGVAQIAGVVVTDGGAGYTQGDPVTFTDTGSGAGATGIANVTAGVITSVSMTNYGTSPYTGTIGVVFGGGGAAATGTASAATGVIANTLISATIEYPLQPQVWLEFMADRNDLDGRLLAFQSTGEITASAVLTDVYESQAILPDITPANPTLHAAACALTASPGFPVQVGVGDFATGRIEKILTVLRSQPDAYWLVGITQDSTAALAFLGGHIDLMVATIAGTQVHFAPGGFRVMLTTLDQRNESQIIPLAKDTTFGTGFLTNLLSGGIAMQANLTGVTGDITKIEPGQYAEFYQTDAISPAANVGSTTIERPIPRRFLITAVDVSIPSASKFTLSDPSLPPSLDPTGPFDTTHFLKHGAPFRIVNVREDLELGGEIRDAVELVGAAPNGRRRWIHQPDIVVLRDLDGVTKAVPGYYRAVIVGAVRASLPPHQGLTGQPLPMLVGVHRDMGFYSDDDVINLMTDGGVDYATQLNGEALVASLQELTANRLNQVTQSPMATQVADYVSKRLSRNVRPYIGRANIFDRTLAGIAALCDATLAGLKAETFPLIGPVILDGQINGSVRRLPITEDSSGIAIDVDITVPQPIDKIKFTVAVDVPPA